VVWHAVDWRCQMEDCAADVCRRLAYVLTFIGRCRAELQVHTSHDNPFWNGMYVMLQQVSGGAPRPGRSSSLPC
jgi:hypothetical protein